ncbi:MAG: hypothetical protein BAJATHORv1_40182 [Candidatus Thorarchaeota archaeon]|nr:MAG: hypothetical protein BAJATHORv1_40182 [Candidatus Thorarchaeota archaeon]
MHDVSSRRYHSTQSLITIIAGAFYESASVHIPDSRGLRCFKDNSLSYLKSGSSIINSTI